MEAGNQGQSTEWEVIDLEINIRDYNYLVGLVPVGNMQLPFQSAIIKRSDVKDNVFLIILF